VVRRDVSVVWVVRCGVSVVWVVRRGVSVVWVVRRGGLEEAPLQRRPLQRRPLPLQVPLDRRGQEASQEGCRAAHPEEGGHHRCRGQVPLRCRG
jgi:hypothetical protein